MRHRISLLIPASTARVMAGRAAGATIWLAACTAVWLTACAQNAPRPGVRTAGHPAGDFHDVSIVNASGRPVPFSNVLARGPSLVAFWAPWCEPCVRELPGLERLARRVAPCGAAVLAVAVGESPVAITAFARERHLMVPQFTDEEFHLADALGQTRVPTTVVFDGAQRIVFVGQDLDARAEAALRATFAGKHGAALEAGCAARD